MKLVPFQFHGETHRVAGAVRFLLFIYFLFSFQFARLGAMLTHSCSLGYNGAVLQALAVHLSLQGALDLPQQFINRLITEMEEVEDDKASQNDARM